MDHFRLRRIRGFLMMSISLNEPETRKQLLQNRLKAKGNGE
jgi:hypothetical protein